MLMFRQKIKQNDLGRALGLNQSGVARRLRGETSWRSSDLIAAARLLNTTVGYLIGETSDPKCTPWDLNPEPTGNGVGVSRIRRLGDLIPIDFARSIRMPVIA